MVVQPQDKVLIVGAGCFGLSTAYHLLKRGFTDVAVVDRSDTLPAPDAASTDLNKVVRSSYSDTFYTRLARDALAEWKNVEEWGDTYHESGVIVLGPNDSASYLFEAYQNDIAAGARLERLDSVDAVRAALPSGVKTGTSEHLSGYLNKDGGWAFAAQGVSKLLDKVTALGGRVFGGKLVTSLVREDGKTVGVVLRDGTTLAADVVVIATGSWTASTFLELDLGDKCLSTGQSVATIQLNLEEAARYRDIPIILDLPSGFYIFPPNADGIVKMAIHGTGHTALTHGADKPISTPRTVSSHGADGLLIPQSRVKLIRSILRTIYPELAEKPFTSTRLCWYTDSPDADWVIGFHPSDSGLVLATSGSGHAYKFLPVIGALVADAIQGTLEASLVNKFAVDRKNSTVDRSRLREAPKDLADEVFCTPADLLP